MEVDARNEKVGKKVAEASVQKLPYMLVVGDRDAAAGNVSVRQRGGLDLGALPGGRVPRPPERRNGPTKLRREP